jgi:hypothetical protein
MLAVVEIVFRPRGRGWLLRVNPRRGRIIRTGPLNPNLPPQRTHPHAAAVRHYRTFPAHRPRLRPALSRCRELDWAKNSLRPVRRREPKMGVQIIEVSSALRLVPRQRLQDLQCSTTPDLPTNGSAVSGRGSQRLKRRHGCCSLSRELSGASARIQRVNVSMPDCATICRPRLTRFTPKFQGKC